MNNGPERITQVNKSDGQGRPLLLAHSRIADIENVCSITPFMPLKKPFWMLGSLTSLLMAYCSRWDARILWKIFPSTEVRAIGRKLAGTAGSPDS